MTSLSADEGNFGLVEFTNSCNKYCGESRTSGNFGSVSCFKSNTLLFTIEEWVALT